MALDPQNLEPGKEQFEQFYDRVMKRYRFQYDYRDMDGNLFSCVASNLELARHRKTIWLKDKQVAIQ